MSQQLDAELRQTGTRFLIFQQKRTLEGFSTPEVVYLNAQPSSTQAGPEDHKMYVIDAL
ncbi:hypothetical protein [Paenibacillus alvei]|uniref:hypothetical protein n=1 Tax=Paenibacillus alvei TaxID=44250 RepID=UPI00227DCB4D|nr:hypothetical protein [Paenibacillus alvei]MCY7482875.1 hypothetical protein [Paenibacillus alvei]